MHPTGAGLSRLTAVNLILALGLLISCASVDAELPKLTVETLRCFYVCK